MTTNGILWLICCPSGSPQYSKRPGKDWIRLGLACFSLQRTMIYQLSETSKAPWWEILLRHEELHAALYSQNTEHAENRQGKGADTLGIFNTAPEKKQSCSIVCLSSENLGRFEFVTLQLNLHNNLWFTHLRYKGGHHQLVSHLY